MLKRWAYVLIYKKVYYIAVGLGDNPNKQLKINKMIKAFKIYKEGTTDNWVTILIPVNEFNDSILKIKIDKFIYLGYKVELI